MSGVSINLWARRLMIGLLLAAVSWGTNRTRFGAAIATATELSGLDTSDYPALNATTESELSVAPGTAVPTGTTDESAEAIELLKLELHLSARQLYVYQGDTLVANYSVAVGREGWATPTGEFSVFQKQIDPAWEHPFTGEIIPPGPDNPLGARWIGFWSDGENSIGFHGTPDESVIGSAVSHGCVRMRNEDVQALYEKVSMNTPVIVLP